MITGFNTDVDYNGVTYHVQTEDKGLDTPLILSLVYNRGTILASKRTPYDDLLLGKFDEKELSVRLQRQHKLICAAIRAGRIEDLKQMNAKTAASAKPEGVKSKKAIVPNLIVEKGNKLEPIESKSSAKIKVSSEKSDVLAPIAKPDIALPEPNKKHANETKSSSGSTAVEENQVDAPIEITDADLIFDENQNLDEIILVPDEAIEILTDFSENGRPKRKEVFIELLNEVVFKSGDGKTISLLVGSGEERDPLVGASILIKVLGSNFRPLIFHSKTDSNGVAIVHLQLPQFSKGRAAVLIKAVSDGNEAEIRRIVQPS